VSDAIPIPGFLDTVAPTIAALRTAPLPPLPVPLPDSNALLGTLASLLPPQLNMDAAGQLSRAGLALDQVASVFGEVCAPVVECTSCVFARMRSLASYA
jgi:hypothetical protein